jgi:hypothetical protein
MPVPAIETCAVDVAVDVPGAYRTKIVQLAPGATTLPDTQVPPAGIEKVPPAVPTLVIVGAAVSVSGPAVAPVAVLVTVMVPFLVLVPPVFKAGVGPVNVAVAPNTVKVSGLLGETAAVVTVTLLAGESAAPLAIVNVAVTVVSFTTVMPLTVTLLPDTVTAVVPVRWLPLRVTGTLVPRTPVLGVIEVSAGVAGAVTLKFRLGVLVTPVTPSVTLMGAFAVTPALDGIWKSAVIVVSLTTVRVVTLMPSPAFTPVTSVSPVPVRVTETVVPRTPVFGTIEVSTGTF